MHKVQVGPATYVDVVNESDEVVDQADRAELRAQGLNFRVAHVFVFNNDGHLLLTQLGTERTNDPGAWGSSVAAHLAASEAYEAAAQRRLFEELGITSPVEFIDKLSLEERRSLKFIGLFRAEAGSYEIREPKHVAAARFVAWPAVLADVRKHPDRYAPTFRLLAETYDARARSS